MLPLSRSYRFLGEHQNDYHMMCFRARIMRASACPRGLSYVPPLRVPVIW